MQFKNILVHVYAEHPSLTVLDTCRHVAATEGAKITLVDVIPDPTWFAKLFGQGVSEPLEKARDSKLAHLQTLADNLGDFAVESRVLHGPTSQALIQEVLQHDHDLVIRDTKGKSSLQTSFFGTTAFQLLRKCPCPVLLLKPGHAWPFERVAAAVDVSNPDDPHANLNVEIMKQATPFAAGDLQNLHVISAWTMFGESVMKDHMREEEFEDVMSKVKTNSETTLDSLVMKFGMGVGWDNVHLFHGDACRVLTEYVAEKEIDLLVMGSVGRVGFSGAVMGNTAEHILNAIECSVLVLKPDGYQSPVKTSS